MLWSRWGGNLRWTGRGGNDHHGIVEVIDDQEHDMSDRLGTRALFDLTGRTALITGSSRAAVAST